jgi:hypothetical protein
MGKHGLNPANVTRVRQAALASVALCVTIINQPMNTDQAASPSVDLTRYQIAIKQNNDSFLPSNSDTVIWVI